MHLNVHKFNATNLRKLIKLQNGKKMQTVNSQFVKVDLSQIPTGLYMVHVQTGKHLFTQKLSVIHQ